MYKKYEILQNVTKEHHGVTLYTIKALKDFGDVKAGDIGGWIENEDNLSQYGKSWIYDDAKVRGKAKVNGYTMVSGDAIVESTYDYIVIKNNWSSERYFTYTRSNKLFRVGCFLGTGEELIAKAYKDSKRSGDCYKASVHYAQALAQAFQDNAR